jgi:hypothetical protein
MRTTLSIIALLGIAAFSAAQARAGDVCAGLAGNIVANCGFETGDLTSWSVSGTDSGPNQYGYEYGVDQLEVDSGSYSGFFGAIGGILDLTQTTGSVAGQTYLVQFDLGQDQTPFSPYLNSVAVSFDGISLLSETQAPVTPYTTYSYVVTAVDSSAVLQFAFRDDTGYFGLDSVEVEAIPEPSTWFLMGTGLLMAGAAVYFRRRGTRNRNQAV